MMGIVLLGIGNAMLHEAGAIATVTVSKGTLFPSALFVAGGSFGLIIGQTLGKYGFNTYYLLIVMVIIEVLVLLTNRYWLREEVNYPKFELTKDIGNEWVIIGVAFAVTTVRSYIGYAIPISWNKTIWQAFALYFVMGAGKAVGGYLADKYGARIIRINDTNNVTEYKGVSKDA